ncbi:NAD-binding protein [Methyloprofundus sp.]|uniref:NAD-binding protein n=1 Tax=Methyloprofundus sp. TaxID=2020875 RepID=UPI003D13C209
MYTSDELSRVSFIVMRQMRLPLIILLTVYSVAIFGMVSIPGPLIDGKTEYLSIFHAFYFMTYTATTTGFGEIPFAFSNAQRLWAIACLYVSVVTWFYALGSIVRLFQNVFFKRAVDELRFALSVNRIGSPFYIICGFGDTGSVLVRGLNDAGMHAVVIDESAERIQALKLRNYKLAVPGLHADASVPKHLLEAGVSNELCKAVVAITSNEEVNLKISAVARLLNPDVGILTMSKMNDIEETLATLGGEVHVIDPFKTFAKVLNACINNPAFYALNNWLVGDKGATLESYVQPPVGSWIIAGYGRMGMEANHVLTMNGVKTAVIDPHSRKKEEEVETYIVGRANAKTLKKAGIEQAVGLLAAADDDGQNLSVLLNARSLNQNLFTIVRQNSHQNELAFAKADADMIMQPTLVSARKILLLLIAPLLKHFFRYLLAKEPGREELIKQVISTLREKIGNKKPLLVTIDFTREKSKAVIDCLDRGEAVLLGDVIASPGNPERELELMVFVIKSGKEEIILPGKKHKIKEGDQLLFCGTAYAKQMLKATINNEYTLHFLRTGKYKPSSYLTLWYARRFKKA